MSDPLTFANLELNNVGSYYLLRPLQNLDAGRTSTTRYFFNGGPFLNTVIPGNATAKFSLLDLSLVPPISQWDRTGDPLQSFTRWTVNSPTPFNLTVGVREIEGAFFPIYTAVYDPSIQVSISERAWADGASIRFRIDTPYTLIMLFVMGGSLTVAIVSSFIDRRLTKMITERGRRRR